MASGALKMKGLLQWCKKHSEGYPGVEVTNFTSSWKDGLAFCAIIHKFRPDLIDFNSLSKENVLENNALAFRLAEQELGIPALLDAEDMVAMRVPDKLCIVTYVSQYYNHLKDINPEGGPGIHKAVKRPGATSPTAAPETKRISKTPQTNKPEKSNGVPSKRGTLGDTCTECGKKVYILERHILEGKLYHRICYRQSEKGRDNYVSRSLSPSSPTRSYEGSIASPKNELSPLRQREDVTNEKKDSPQKVTSRPKIPESLVDKSSDSKASGRNGPSWQRQQGARTESPMETNEKDSNEPAWMKWVDKDAVAEKKSPEKGAAKPVKSGAISNGAIKDRSPASSANTVSKFNVQVGKKDMPSSTPIAEKQFEKKTEISDKSGANSKPEWARSDPKAGLKNAADSRPPTASWSALSSQGNTPRLKTTRVETKMETDAPKVSKVVSPYSKTTEAKSTPTPSISISSDQVPSGGRGDEAAKAGLLQSLAGIRHGAKLTPAGESATPVVKTSRDKSPVKISMATNKATPTGKLTDRPGDNVTPSPWTKQPDKTPAKSLSSPEKVTPSSNQRDKSPSKPTSSPEKAKFTIRTNEDVKPSAINQRGKSPVRPNQSPSSSAVDVSKLSTPVATKAKTDKEPTSVTKTKRDLSPAVAKTEKKSDATSSATKWAGSGEKLSAGVTKPDTSKTPTSIKPEGDAGKKASPDLRKARSPQKATTKTDAKVSSSIDVKPGGSGQAGKAVSMIIESPDVRMRTDSSPSRPVSVIPGAAPPPKPPRTLLRDAKLDTRPEWQIEAEKRKNARKGEYKDPEKPWLYQDSGPKENENRKSEYPESKNPFGSDDVDSPVKEKKYRSSNPFGSTDTLDESPLDEKPKYRPANPFAGSSSDSDSDVTNPFAGDDLPIKTSTMRPNEKKQPSTPINQSVPSAKLAWSDKSDSDRGSVKKRAAPRPPGPTPQNLKQNGNLKPSSAPPARPASPNRKGQAPRSSSSTPGGTPQGSPAKSHLAPGSTKPEWTVSPQKNLKKIKPDTFEFNRMSSTECESDSSYLESPMHRPSARSPGVRRSVKSMPAPPLPIPASRRKIITEERISPDQIVRELDELDKRQTVIEGKARILEEAIRDAEVNESPKEDELLMQWFEMVNDKNQLVRREADLVYLNRQQELEEMHAEVEHDLRLLMSKQEQLKTQADREREEELLQELLEIVNQRNNIVENMDEDRLRYEEEDRVIEEMMALKFEGKPSSSEEKTKKKKKKDKKKKKKHSGSEFHCASPQK